jgi:hypothetical protein
MSTFFDVGGRSTPRGPVDEVERVVAGATWMIGPVAPAPAVVGRPVVVGRVEHGTLAISLRLVNLQAAAAPVRAAVGSLLSGTGLLWRPRASAFVFVGAGTTAELELMATVPPELTPGTYEGAIILTAVRMGRALLTVEVP